MERPLSAAESRKKTSLKGRQRNQKKASNPRSRPTNRSTPRPTSSLSKPTEDIATKEFETEQTIHLSIKEALEHMLTEEHDTVKQRAQFLRECFPSNTLGQMMTQFLPKAKDTDQGLVESHISLTKSFESIPTTNDLTAHIHVLKTELIQANARIRQLNYYMETVKRNLPKQQRRMYALLKKVQSDARSYAQRRHEVPLSGAPWAKEPNPLSWEKALEEIYGLDYAKTLRCVMPEEIVSEKERDVEPLFIHKKRPTILPPSPEVKELDKLYEEPDSIVNVNNLKGKTSSHPASRIPHPAPRIPPLASRPPSPDPPPGWSDECS